MEKIFFDTIYIVSTILFILGLKKLSNPATSSTGNKFAALGMFIAIFASIMIPIKGDQNYLWIIISIFLGAIIGYRSSIKVAMTAMPELVSIFNGLGGGCAMLISVAEISTLIKENDFNRPGLTAVMLTLIIGSLSFTGSLVAFAKLNGNIKDVRARLMKIFNYFILLIIVGLFIYIIYQNKIQLELLILVLVLSLVYGIIFVIPIGGADMPVVISILNSFTGITSLLAGIIYNNYIMILGGILVGSSGMILTILMCNAMNRSLLSVLFGTILTNISASNGNEKKTYKITRVDDVSISLYYSKSVVFIPGYGMAVAQAQRICKDIETLLEKNGVEVKYGIHPVAGRMPGHMNILLAEVDVNYEKLMNLEDANDYFNNTDTAIVVGGNDVVNLLAIEDKTSSIYGMPILDLRKVKNVIVLKRSMNPGYAGIDNSLFYKENTSMLFGDAKKSLQAIFNELKEMN